MKNNSNLVYDVDGLVAAAKKNLRNSIVKIGVSVVVLALSILAVFFFGTYVFVFIGGAMLACVSAIFYINDGEQIRACYLKCASEEHAQYYESKGEVIHIWGTHFPVKLQAENDKWLCPVCGEFNTIDKRTCSRCKNKIIK